MVMTGIKILKNKKNSCTKLIDRTNKKNFLHLDLSFGPNVSKPNIPSQCQEMPISSLMERKKILHPCNVLTG